MAGPGSTFANVTDALTLNYDKPFKGKVEWSHGALAAMLTKTKGGGLNCVVPIRSGVSPAVSSTFTDAQTKATTQYTKVEQFLPPWTKKYGVAQIDGLLMAAASADKGQLFDKFCAQIDGIMDGTMQQFSRDVYGNGYGAYGKVAATGVQTLASTRLKLANPEDIVNFQRGQSLILAASDTAAARTSGTPVVVTGIEDLQLGYITLAANLATTLSDATYGDSIYVLGNRGVGASPTQLCLNGLDAWFPTTVPSTTDWATGVDRSADANLRGTIIDASTSTSNMEELVIEAVTSSSRFGGSPERMVFFTNNTNYKKMILLGMSKFRPTTTKGPYGIGFQGVKVFTDAGEITVQPDRFCPVQRSYLLEMSTIKYIGVASASVPDFLIHDENGHVLRMTDADAVECRVGYYGAMACNKPVVNVVVIHSTT